ncbi:MAG TPA: hypothetical protein DCX06_05055 [Opitutae bacterium]|nr:hypothetical protein [Opitutae bacterium]
MSRLNHNGMDNLRHGRASVPNGRYFITICTKGRQVDLNQGRVFRKVVESLREMHLNSDIYLYCATIMPDHLHLLYRLGESLKLGQIQAKLKSQTRESLNAEGFLWQDNYYDHYLREDDALEGFAKYIYLNPHVKRLISLDSDWPYWLLNRDYKPEFIDLVESCGGVPEEWVASAMSANDLIESYRRV